MSRPVWIILLLGSLAAVMTVIVRSQEKNTQRELTVLEQIISYDQAADEGWSIGEADSLASADNDHRYKGLTDEDFQTVARELDVEVAAIKAVVYIEAGSQMKGFWAPGVPVINFDPSMYARFRAKATVKTGDKNAKVPPGLKGYAHKEWTQLTNARRVNRQGADMGTFWGMFQIGGFNYRQCGCQSVEEFVERMSYSDFEQLELFGAFITSGGMLADLRNKNWAAFSRKYNGPSYARRGYHTRMAAAYRKYGVKG
ncbi:MAG: N-acetylmuramidase family protein [Muribaculaceae bacterium]|nr:N-acetylmuramidase family protein [Muribaculaceae bacterium]